MPKTRSKTAHYIVGHPSPLPPSKLPTRGDAINYIRFLEKERDIYRSAPGTATFHKVASEISDIWTKEGIPIHHPKYVVKRLRVEYDLMKKANKIPSTARACNDNLHFSQLFDVAICKCASQEICCCPRDSKIPDEEWSFVYDQRHDRQLTLGAWDRATTDLRNARAQRREARHRQHHGETTDTGGKDDGAEGISSSSIITSSVTEEGSGSASGDQTMYPGNNRAGNSASSCETQDCANLAGGSSETIQNPWSSADEDGDGLSDPDFVGTFTEVEERNFTSLRETALAADRYHVSNRAAAAIINAYLNDIGQKERSNIVDAKKIWRARKSVRLEASHDNADEIHAAGLTSLYFDGRKDATCVEYTAPTKVEEHVVVIAEPEERYVTHFTPLSGKAWDQVMELYPIAVEYGGNIKVLGCDGTAVNTGTSAGICRLFEIITQTPVHWFICQLHGNELNLRQLFHHLDGTTTGPKSFSGPVGKACATDVWERDLVPFEAVPGNVQDIPDEVVRDLSRDQRHMYHMARAVQDGHVPAQTASRRIGALHHAR